MSSDRKKRRCLIYRACLFVFVCAAELGLGLTFNAKGHPLSWTVVVDETDSPPSPQLRKAAAAPHEEPSDSKPPAWLGSICRSMVPWFVFNSASHPSHRPREGVRQDGAIQLSSRKNESRGKKPKSHQEDNTSSDQSG